MKAVQSILLEARISLVSCVIKDIHVPILKPQSVWSDLFVFRVLRKLNFTRAKACRDTFQDFNLRQLWRSIYKKLGSSEKNKYPSHVYYLYLIYRGDFREHHVSIKQTGRLEWHLIGSLKSHTRKPIKFKVNFWKSEAFLTDPTNIARK